MRAVRICYPARDYPESVPPGKSGILHHGRISVSREERAACAADRPAFPGDSAFFSLDNPTTERGLPFGPDAFQLQLEGPEIALCPMWHNGECHYVCEFGLTLHGRYRLSAFLYHEHWMNLRELMPFQ